MLSVKQRILYNIGSIELLKTLILPNLCFDNRLKGLQALLSENRNNKFLSNNKLGQRVENIPRLKNQ